MKKNAAYYILYKHAYIIPYFLFHLKFSSKAGEFQIRRETRRRPLKPGVSRSYREGWNICIPYHTISYHTISYHTITNHNIPYHTIPYHIIPKQTITYHTIPYNTIPYHTIPYHTIPYHTISYHTIQ